MNKVWKFQKKRRQGFTLVEFLVVVLIIAILTALIFPLGRGLVDEGLKATCLGNLRGYGVAIMTMTADQGGIPRVADITDIDFKSLLVPVYINQLPHCPLANSSDKTNSTGFNYAGNSGLFFYFPTLKGMPAPQSRVVLAAETYGSGGFYSPTHFNMTIWGNSDTAAPGPATEGSVRRPQYHGSSNRRGLNMMFLDGHAALVAATTNDWWQPPTLGTAANGGYFYNRTQFADMAAGKAW